VSRAGRHGGGRAVGVLEMEHHAAQLVERLGVQRVEHVRTIDGDDRDRAVAFEQQVVEGHNGYQSGNGYISQPSTTAAAMKPANSRPPNRICSRRSSFVRTAKTSETNNANSTSSSRWLCIICGPWRCRRRR